MRIQTKIGLLAGTVLFSLIALNQTKTDPAKGGKGLAIAGVAVSIAGIVLLGLLLVFGVIEKFFK